MTCNCDVREDPRLQILTNRIDRDALSVVDLFLFDPYEDDW